VTLNWKITGVVYELDWSIYIILNFVL
jgi:hypothetical protein